MAVTVECWRRVGAAVIARREALGWSQADLIRESGISDLTIRRIERGTPAIYRPTTRHRICVALGWVPGSIERILAGGDPEEATPTPPVDGLQQLQAELGVLRGQVAELAADVGLLLDLANARVAGDVGKPPAASEGASS